VKKKKARWRDIGAAAAALLAAAKFFMFYAIIGVKTFFVPIWLLSCLMALLFFSAFRNKWIPAAAYAAFSVVLFCDVAYDSYFGRYPSFGALGAAAELEGLGDGLWVLIRPEFLLVLLDAALILLMLAAEALAPRLSASVAERLERGVEVPDLWRPVADMLRRVRDDMARDIATGLKATAAFLAKRKSAAAFLLILAVALWNPWQAPLFTAIANQEILSFHLRDAFGAGQAEAGASEDFMALIDADNYASEKDGELFGALKGRNLIVIQVESLQNFVVGRAYNGKEITPTLNTLIKGDSIYFDNFYQQVGSGNTSDAEFAVNNSVCGTIRTFTYKLFPDNVYRGLPVLLREKGYSAAVFHAYEDRDYWNRDSMYRSEGFSRFYGGLTDKGGDYDMTEWMGWGLTDSEFYKQSVPMMAGMEKPFYSFLISLSNHHPFAMLEKYRLIDLMPQERNTLAGNYIQSAAYTDYAIGQFIEELKSRGLYRNSVIAVYGDHQGLVMDSANFRSMERLLGKRYDYDTMMNVPLIIHAPGVKGLNRVVHAAGGQIDFMPTIAYLLGFEELDTIHLGHNLLNQDEGFAAFQCYMLKGSFVSGDVMFEMSRDGIFENGRAWNKKTGERLETEDYRAQYLRAVNIIDASDYILDNDLLAERYGANDAIVDSYTRPAPASGPPEEGSAGAGTADDGDAEGSGNAGSPASRDAAGAGTADDGDAAGSGSAGSSTGQDEDSEGSGSAGSPAGRDAEGDESAASPGAITPSGLDSG
jgi:phosphoglycerol transferase MdoB-like AlkP superfamily enzyme